MLKMVLAANPSLANSGHTVMAGNSSSPSPTLSIVLVLGSSSQPLTQEDSIINMDTKIITLI